MISPDIKKLLGEMSLTPYGKALLTYLEEKQKEIGDISTVESWDETLGRKYTLKLIKEMFAVLEKKEPTDKSKNQYL